MPISNNKPALTSFSALDTMAASPPLLASKIGPGKPAAQALLRISYQIYIKKNTIKQLVLLITEKNKRFQRKRDT